LLPREPWSWSSALSEETKAASGTGPALPDYYLDSIPQIELALGWAMETRSLPETLLRRETGFLRACPVYPGSCDSLISDGCV
jgi:hypothetical protein